ncbi:MAG: rod shape-determining protein MreC [Minisyncoccia bacterium]
MTSLLDKTQKSHYKKNRLIVGDVVFVLFLFIILFFSSRAIKHTRSRGEFITVPLWRLDERIVLIGKDLHYYFTSRNALENYITDLKNQVQNLQSANAELQVLKDENVKLKSQMSRSEANQRILATILVKPNRTPYDTIIVDAGSIEGVVSGSKVYANGNTLIGTVADVSTHTAHIILFSTPGQQTDGVVVGTDITVTLTGRGGGAFEIDVPREVVLPVGNVVTNVATFSNPIAIIGTQISSDRDAIKKILAKTPINIQELKWVEIVK